MHRQRGASGVLIAVILVLVTLLILAVSALTRTTDANQQREQGLAALATTASALESYVSASQRLPCPADPTADTGVEVPNGAANCQFPEGTLPWQTIGMRRDDSFDAWGRKISYRVYTGNAGSLTQAGGASMANCDTNEAFPGGTTPTGGGTGGLCNPVPNTSNPADRNTTPAQFLAGKGLTLTDMSTVHNDVAYVLISHGITGLGGYTASGTRLDMPSSAEEKNNTKDTGPFTIRAFSDPDTGATENGHFDDLLAYRTVADLATRANLAARNWPDTILSSVVFDRATLTTALGSNPGSDTGTTNIAFNNATVRGFDSGGSQDISFVGSGTDGIGGVNGGDTLASGAGGPDEGLQIDFAEPARQFAFTLNGFGYQSTFFGIPIWIERAELRFYTLDSAGVATLVATVTKFGCQPDGGLASFSVDPGVSFARVEIRPLTTTTFFTANPSGFLVSEIRSCAAGVTCQTSLQTPGNACS